MIFVKADQLKIGMRLARPIYNKNGVLLYERNSKLTPQGINSIKNFGLIGIFVLEPAEPVPPMTVEDINFERFQTMYVFAIQEELRMILNMNRAPKMQTIIANITKEYGHFDKKINFVQNLRSREDYIFKHALNVAILTTLMSHVMNVRLEEQMDMILAAIVHDIGKLTVPKNIREKGIITEQDRETERHCEISGYDIIEKVFSANPNVKRICSQARKATDDYRDGKESTMKLTIGAKVLMVADTYDTLTAMRFEEEPQSEVAAIRYLLENPELYDDRCVEALIKSINILAPGTSIELNTGEKGLVITQNDRDILRPMILSFKDNNIIDLSNEFIYGDLEIKDMMKTMDNRYIMDTSALRKQGFQVEEPEYVPCAEEEEEYVPGKF